MLNCLASPPVNEFERFLTVILINETTGLSYDFIVDFGFVASIGSS